MPIEAPSDNIILPEDIAKAIEIGKNNLTLAQVETNRLIRLKGQLEKEIGTLNVEKVNLEEKVRTAQETFDKTIIAINQANSDLETAHQTIKNIKDEQTTISGRMIQQGIELNDKRMKLDDDIAIFEAKQSELLVSIQNHQKDKQEFETKRKLLADTIKQI